jgi:hypothetical protein
MLFWRKNFEDGKCPGRASTAPYLELLLLFGALIILQEKNMLPLTGTKYQLHSQGKLTTPRREKSKNST